MIIEWTDVDRSRLHNLFDTFKTCRAVIFPALSQNRGHIWVDSLDSPTVAKLQLNVLNFIVGDNDSVSAKELLQTIEPMQPLFVPDDWIDFVSGEWGDRLGTQKRTLMSPDSLDIKYLRGIRDRLQKEYRLERVDLETAKKLDKGVYKHIAMFFDGSADFAKNGISFCVKHEGKVISIASTYTPFTNKFDVQVDTIDDHAHRRRGLATVVCAALMVYALENNVVPHWDAANDISVQLALKLGYTDPYEWNLFYLKPP
ncbi:MAG: GNAT family N-acetyltransferase [Candidatus Thorarchaeota archaeon]|nr:GNAT family N-acetyltransferase [Candidatus Thorarchaeota archaeon]